MIQQIALQPLLFSSLRQFASFALLAMVLVTRFPCPLLADGLFLHFSCISSRRGSAAAYSALSRRRHHADKQARDLGLVCLRHRCRGFRRLCRGWVTPFLSELLFLTFFASTGSFLPLTLEQLARERGALHSSHLPCVGPGSPGQTPGNGTESPVLARDGSEEEQCVVGLFGLQINTASFAMYTFSLAVLVQALTLVSFSALADYGMVEFACGCAGIDID